ncbi:cell wall metabolism sensor histidine kinase WalK [Streptomyces albus]|uniref:sensor histidine kinase n=1 Tax=Streptomyces albus TaxID=1888 RepID=UPI00068995D1|nr:HAMP domain-containing sensor histidine kinase [Streptomyces albus]
MTLRTRLVLVLSGLLGLGMVISVGATFGALQDWRNDQSDKVLAAAAQRLHDDLTERHGNGGGSRLAMPGNDRDQLAAVWAASAGQGDIPSFFQIRTPDGRVRQTAGFGARPELPRTLPPALRPDRPAEGNPSGGVFHRVPGADGDTDWLLHSSRLPDGFLLVGMRTAGADELISRTAVVAATSAVVALLGVTLLSRRAVRRGLRPLESIAATASAIGGGDLARRVPEAGPRTEVGRLGRALNAMLGQIQSAFEERRRTEDRLRRFVADASHELRTPVATIRGYAELFRRGAAHRPADLAQAMSRIESEARRMGSLVEELLLLAKLDQGLPLAGEPVDLNSLAAEAVDDARVLAPGSPLFFEPGADGPVIVRGDADRLRQVLANLLANVRHHTPEGTESRVRIGRRDGWAVIEVKDSGPGLDEEQARHVFERFYRADPSRARSRHPGGGPPEGSGLGLAIVAAVAGAHGGGAEVDTGPGKGAAFRVLLPVAAADGRRDERPRAAARCRSRPAPERVGSARMWPAEPTGNATEES